LLQGNLLLYRSRSHNHRKLQKELENQEKKKYDEKAVEWAQQWIRVMEASNAQMRQEMEEAKTGVQAIETIWTRIEELNREETRKKAWQSQCRITATGEGIIRFLNQSLCVRQIE
jgi:hypothetical protein